MILDNFLLAVALLGLITSVGYLWAELRSRSRNEKGPVRTGPFIESLDRP